MEEGYTQATIQRSNAEKILHFVFLFISILLITRVFTHAVRVYSFFWIGFAILTFSTVYFPFTSTALDFYKLPLKTKLKKYLKKSLILDAILAAISIIPALLCSIEGSSECYAALLSYIGFALLGLLAVAQILSILMIYLSHMIEKTSKNIRYILFIMIIIILFLISQFVYIIPFTPANLKSNEYFLQTNKCEKMNIYDIPIIELRKQGCHDFYIFNKDGTLKDDWDAPGNGPINAFRQCFYKSDRDGNEVRHKTGGYRMFTIDCNEIEKHSDKQIFFYNKGEYSIVPRKYMDKYGFDEDDYYFDVCKVILTDYINEKIIECKNK